MRGSQFVGRVGGLAIALGVGVAIAGGGVGTAWAQPAADAAETDSAATSTTGRGDTTRTRSVPNGNSRKDDNDHPSSAKPTRPAAAAKVPVVRVDVREVAPELVHTAASSAAAALVSVTAAPALAVAPALAAVPSAQRASAATPVIAGVLRSLAAGLAGLNQPVPAVPVESPVAWAVAAATTRRTINAQARATAAATANPIATFFFNQTPTLSPTRIGQDSASVVTGDLNISDPDSDVEVYTVTRAPVNGTVTVDSDGQYTYVPDPYFARAGTTDTFTVSVSDAESGFHLHGIGGLFNLLTFGLLGDSGHASTATVTVVVDPRNEVPVGTVSIGATDPVNGEVVGRVVGSDADGDPLTYAGSTTTSKGAATVAADGSFSYLPTPDARHDAAALVATEVDKTDTFTVTINDGYGGNTNVAVRVDISPLNEAPVAGLTVGSPDPTTGVVTGRVSATDPDGDPLTYSGTTTTSKGSVTVAADGAFTYTPTAAARHGAARLSGSVADKTDTFTVTVTDDSGGVTAVPVTVTLSPTNIAPVAGGASVAAPNATSGLVSGSITASDGDGDPLSYSAAPPNGSVSFSGNGGFAYYPTAQARQNAANGGATTDSFTVTIADGYGGTATVGLTVGIAPALAPAALAFNFSYGSGSQYWTAEARSALESAAASLASYFIVSTPTTITVTVTGNNSPSSNNLAYASVGFTSYSAGYYGTIVQSKILTGVDSNGASADALISYNWAQPWALGNTVSGSQYDFKAVAIHELLHAVGFLTGADNSPGNVNWTIFDRYLRTAGGTPVIDPNTYAVISGYEGNFTGSGGGLYFTGPNAGSVQLYTPGTWSSGSSLSHVNPQGGFVMNPFYGTGSGPRVLSATEVGILRDLGYTVNNSPGVAAFVVVWVSLVRRRRNR